MLLTDTAQNKNLLTVGADRAWRKVCNYLSQKSAYQLFDIKFRMKTYSDRIVMDTLF